MILSSKSPRIAGISPGTPCREPSNLQLSILSPFPFSTRVLAIFFHFYLNEGLK